VVAVSLVFDAHVQAIDPSLNAIVAVADFVEPVPGPLCGVPFTVKDNLSVAGLPMIIGVPSRRDVVGATDATVVTRLRAAGAVLLGKTNCPPWAGGIETSNEVFGRTENPYDRARSVGGSSGGEAAAIASGCSGFGLGTDSGASVRLPAHFCGLAALKPTAGLVPVTGVIDDLGQLGALSDPRTQVGPLARSVTDLALVLSIIAGPDSADGGVAPVPLEPPGDVRGLRVAVLVDDGHVAPDADTLRVLSSAAAALVEAGARVEHAVPPAGGHELTVQVWNSYGDEAIGYDLLRRWDAFRSAMLAFGEAFDVILSPVFGTPAPPHGEVPNDTSYTTPHNLSGWPAATVRCGTSWDGLPIGVQVIAHPWRDAVALAVAAALEGALGGYVIPE
jgi:amidase